MKVNSLDIYLRDALTILQISLELYEQGRSEFYRVMALELRLLLCDTTRRHSRAVNIALAPRLRPGLRLSTLNPVGEFDPTLPRLPLAAWLEQPIPELGLSLRVLIRQVCDQDGGAHVDPHAETALPSDGDQREWIARMARCVLSELG